MLPASRYHADGRVLVQIPSTKHPFKLVWKCQGAQHTTTVLANEANGTLVAPSRRRISVNQALITDRLTLYLPLTHSAFRWWPVFLPGLLSASNAMTTLASTSQAVRALEPSCALQSAGSVAVMLRCALRLQNEV